MTKLYKYMAYVLGLILISIVLITIFEYDHFSEVLGKPLGEITVIDVLMQSLGGQWLQLLLLDMVI